VGSGLLTLTAGELREITGYTQPSKQLLELHRQGFYRARRSPTSGAVILERAHHDAVASGRVTAPPAPKLHQPKLRAV
jgi:hypothetical protein